MANRKYLSGICINLLLNNLQVLLQQFKIIDFHIFFFDNRTHFFVILTKLTFNLYHLSHLDGQLCKFTPQKDKK